MRFIDEAKVFIEAGSGGSGCCSFRREKFIEFGGPDGGNGGDGGNVIFVADRNVNTLLKFRYNPHLKAENGKRGMGARRAGADGLDVTYKVPVGTEIIDSDNVLIADLVDDNQQFTIANGGKGGSGNANFKSSTNKAPRHFSTGFPGEKIEIVLRLKILADAGLVGFPNAGKSTFLSLCSNAKPKIADYPFSTTSPSLGIVSVDNSEFVIADIPGLIKGAHEGVGLGDRFLKHIERCKALIYMIDITSNIIDSYKILTSELKLHNKNLEKKPFIILLTKSDLVSCDVINEKISLMREEVNYKVLSVSMKSNIDASAREILSMVATNDVKKFEKFNPLDV